MSANPAKLSEYDVIQTAIKVNGIQQQTIVATEELAELIQALTKAMRGMLNKENLTEEIADVYIVLSEVKEMYHVTNDDVRKIIKQKMERLCHRLSQY